MSELSTLRMNTLVGQQTYHPGPNCYNAVSYVSGFTDFLYQSSSMELKYYLSEYCQENHGTPRAGDLFIIGVPGVPFQESFEHAVIRLEDTNIFEKGATTGLYSSILDSPYADKEASLKDTFYARRSYLESNYTKMCAGRKNNCRYFSCHQKELQQTSIKKCERFSGYENLKSVQQLLQNISFSKDRNIFSQLEKVYESLDLLIEDMNRLNLDDDCSIYFLASWNSIHWHLSYGLENFSDQKNPRVGTFGEKLKDLYTKISAQKKDPKSQFILSGGL